MSSNVVAFRKFTLSPEQELQEIHTPFVPAEVYQGESITADVFLKSESRAYRMPVYRISPLGVELLMTSEVLELKQSLERGSEIDLNIRLGKQNCEYFGLVVASRHKDGDHDLLGVRWCYQKKIREEGVDRRKAARWLCGDQFLPTGMAPNPTRFNDFIYFKVKDISKEGMQIITSLRNKFLIPGMYLESTLSFPMVSQVSTTLKINNARITTVDGMDQLSLGVRVQNADHRVLEAIGQYLLQFSPENSAEKLKKEGIPVRSVASAVEFSYVKTAEDYKAVLTLRRDTYSAVGKIPKDTKPEETGDIYDTRARIVMARHHGKVVGSLRLMFHDPENEMEHEEFVSFPSSFPRKDQIVEVTRFCTHPDYRGNDLFHALIKHMMLTVAQSKRRYILGSATPQLMDVYKNIGFQGTGVYYHHRALAGEKHEICLADVPKILSGSGVGPALWNELYSDVSDYLKDQYDFEFEPMMNLRMAVYKAVGPVTKIFTRSVRNPKAD